MKITIIETTEMIRSKLANNLSARRRQLLRLILRPSEEAPSTHTGPDDWQDDGAVGIRGWYY